MYEHQHKYTGDISRRNTKKIDHVLISHNLILTVKHLGFLPWNQIMESDHRTGFLDFDENELFGKITEDPTHSASRKLSTDYPELIDKYLKILNKKVTQNNIEKSVSVLITKARHGWTKKREREYNKIDALLTRIMVNA